VTAAWRVVPEGLRLAVRLQPGARRSGVEGLERLADGSLVLKVKVTPPPEDGRANAALLALLAREWKLPKRGLSIVAGHTARNKTLLLSGDGAALERLLRERCPPPG